MAKKTCGTCKHFNLFDELDATFIEGEDEGSCTVKLPMVVEDFEYAIETEASRKAKDCPCYKNT